jgi:hypothetical protein
MGLPWDEREQKALFNNATNLNAPTAKGKACVLVAWKDTKMLPEPLLRSCITALL